MRSVLSISLPEDIAAALNKYAKEMHRSKSEIVKESISLYLWESQFNRARRSMAGRAKKHGIITDDDVFDAVS